MTLLKRATIKSYDAGTHRASVGISGSLSVWLDGIAVSDSIPAAAVVAGRECAVLFHDDVNPDDAVVVSVHGGGPPATTPTTIADADGDTKIQTEESSDEDYIRFDTAGTERAYIDPSGRWKWQQLFGHAFGDSPHDNTRAFNYAPLAVSTTTDRAIWVISPVMVPTVADKSFWAFAGNMIVRSNKNVLLMRGLSFAVVTDATSGTPTITEASGATTQAGNIVGNPIATDVAGFRHIAPFFINNPSYTRYQAVWSNFPGTVKATTVTGLRIDDITAGTNKYLMWAGPNVPGAAGVTNLRLDAGNPPNVGLVGQGDSQLHLTFMENGTLAMRRVRHKKFSILTANDKVMIAA